MFRITSLFILIILLLSCERKEDPVDQDLLTGPFELIADKLSLCPSEKVELKLFSYAKPDQVIQIPISLAVFDPIPPELGKVDNNGFYTAPSSIQSTRVVTLKAKLKTNPALEFSIDLELFASNGKGGIQTQNYPPIPVFGSGSQGPIRDFNQYGEYLTGPVYYSGPTKDIALHASLYDSLRRYKLTYQGNGINTDFVKFFDQRVVLTGVSYTYQYLLYLFEYNGELVRQFSIPDNYLPLELKENPYSNWFFLTKDKRYDPSSFRLFAVDQEMNFNYLFDLNSEISDLVPGFFPLTKNQFLVDFQTEKADPGRISLLDETGKPIWKKEYGFYGSQTKLLAQELPNGNLVMITSEKSQTGKTVKYVYRKVDRATGAETEKTIFLEGNSMTFSIDPTKKLYDDIERILITNLGLTWIIGKFTHENKTGFFIWNSNGKQKEIIIPTETENYWWVYLSRFEEWGEGIRLSVITPNKKIDFHFGPNLDFNPCN